MPTKTIVSILLLLGPAVGQELASADPATRLLPSIDVRTAPRQGESRRLYSASVAALIGANAADLASSYGRPELNPMLTPGAPGGRFGWQSATIKLGIAAGSLAFQRIVLRRRPELHRAFAVSNFVVAGAMSGVAVRNQMVGAPRIP